MVLPACASVYGEPGAVPGHADGSCHGTLHARTVRPLSAPLTDTGAQGQPGGAARPQAQSRVQGPAAPRPPHPAALAEGAEPRWAARGRDGAEEWMAWIRPRTLRPPQPPLPRAAVPLPGWKRLLVSLKRRIIICRQDLSSHINNRMSDFVCSTFLLE